MDELLFIIADIIQNENLIYVDKNIPGKKQDRAYWDV